MSYRLVSHSITISVMKMSGQFFILIPYFGGRFEILNKMHTVKVEGGETNWRSPRIMEASKRTKVISMLSIMY
jgi:hypothetical protein